MMDVFKFPILHNILVGCLLIFLTSLIHLILTKLSTDYLKQSVSATAVKRVLMIEMIVLMTILASLAEASLWSVCYLANDAFQSFEEALYFSLVTYSTLGYGDVILDSPHRLLAGFEAANGIIMFGWSTALVIATIQQLLLSSSGSHQA